MSVWQERDSWDESGNGRGEEEEGGVGAGGKAQERLASVTIPRRRGRRAAGQSFKGTPDTRLTAFSPDDGLAKSSKLLQGLARSSSATPPVGLPVSGFRGAATHLDKDPFVTPLLSVGNQAVADSLDLQSLCRYHQDSPYLATADPLPRLSAMTLDCPDISTCHLPFPFRCLR